MLGQWLLLEFRRRVPRNCVWLLTGTQFLGCFREEDGYQDRFLLAKITMEVREAAAQDEQPTSPSPKFGEQNITNVMTTIIVSSAGREFVIDCPPLEARQ